MLDVRHLVVLREVAHQGSFAAAADALHFSPSAVSQQIAALERYTGSTLFERRRRGALLTDCGRVLLRHAEAVISCLADAEAELDVVADNRGERLRFGSFTSATATFVARAVDRFRRDNRTVDVEFFDGEPYEAARLLRARELDLAVVFEFGARGLGISYDGVRVCDDAEMECIHLFDDPLLLAVPRDHRLASASRVAPSDLRAETIIGSPVLREALSSSFGDDATGMRFDASCRATGFEAFQCLAAAGRGLTLIPRLAIEWLREDLVALPLTHAPVRSVKAATPVRATRTTATCAMLEILTDPAGRPAAGEIEVDAAEAVARRQRTAA